MFNSDIKLQLKALEDEIGPLKTDVAALKIHREECDSLHSKNTEYHKRSDDAIKQNTESNLLLAKALINLNATVTDITGTVKKDRDSIKFVDNIRTWSTVSGWIWLKMVAVASGVMVIAGLFQFIMSKII